MSTLVQCRTAHGIACLKSDFSSISRFICVKRLKKETRSSTSICSTSFERKNTTHKLTSFNPRCSEAHDVVLSSGFLSFANHCGFLQAVEDSNIHIGGIMGTSAGALTGSLYAAGYKPKEILTLLCEKPPVEWLGTPSGPWGVLSLEKVVDRFRGLLPETFEELDIPFAVGVVESKGIKSGKYKIIHSGPLAEAVVASAAVPFLFVPVCIPGQQGMKYIDGGKHDRVGLRAWRERRRTTGASFGPVPPVLAHVIERSSQFSGDDDIKQLLLEEERVLFVRSPKSGLSLTSVGNYEADFQQVVRRVGLDIGSQLAKGQAGKQSR